MAMPDPAGKQLVPGWQLIGTGSSGALLSLLLLLLIL
jgi:hypothetical protein